MMYVSQIIILYTLHLRTHIYQLHLSETGRRKDKVVH